MARFVLLGLVMFAGALAAGWVGRTALGRRLRGPAVGLWGALFGVVGVFLMGYVVEGLGSTGFLAIGEGGSPGIGFLMFFGWNVGLLGGLVGAMAASVRPRQQRPPEKP